MKNEILCIFKLSFAINKIYSIYLGFHRLYKNFDNFLYPSSLRLKQEKCLVGQQKYVASHHNHSVLSKTRQITVLMLIGQFLQMMELNVQKYLYIPTDIVECFQGRHPEEIRAQKAFSKFKENFERHEDKNNSAFRLKNLYLLDRAVQQCSMLDIIAHYEYNRLFFERNKSDPSLKENQSQFIQQFIGSYYLCIKKKADTYQKLPSELFYNKDRKSYINNAQNTNRIFQFIDSCLQLDKNLQQVHEKTKKLNKSPELIQEILTIMLKTAIFTYSIVSICIQTLLNKIKLLKNIDLHKLDKLLKYFNRQYSQAFMNFLESNKSIDSFKNFQYSELIKIDPRYIQIFDNYYKLKIEQANSSKVLLNSSSGSKIQANSNTKLNGNTPFQEETNDQENQIEQIPDQVFSKLTLQMKFSFKPRLPFEEVISSDAYLYTKAFQMYQNFYHESFQVQQKDLTISDVKSEPDQQKKKSKILKKKSLMQDLVNSQSVRKSLSRSNTIKSVDDNKFKLSIWVTWNNIYSN